MFDPFLPFVQDRSVGKESKDLILDAHQSRLGDSAYKQGAVPVTTLVLVPSPPLPRELSLPG
jgi:hypothetical protein